MVIDISNVGLGHSLNEYEMCRLQSGTIYQYMSNLNKESKSEFNFIIMAMSVFNILEHHDSFKSVEVVYETGIYFAGTLYGFKCYIDIHLKSNEIIMKYDRQTSRENKLNDILGDSNTVNELKLFVLLEDKE